MSTELQRIRQLEGEALAREARIKRLTGCLRWAEYQLRIQHPLPAGLQQTLRELRADMAAMGISTDITGHDGCGADAQCAEAAEGSASATHPGHE